MKQGEGSVLACFHSSLSFAIAGRVTATSAFHNAVLRSDRDTKFGAAPKFTTIVGSPGKGRDVTVS